ncbi:aminopeptidase P family protein [Ruminococcus sp.]|uniref:aminopeptidase P family protein n=1 Tax=Ruminococcus sp. TaxID=41978 RepID=UPI003F037794
MNSEIFCKRINTLKTVLNNNDEGLFITNQKNIGYLCGFFNSEGVMLVTTERTFLFVDFRYIEAAKKKSSSCEVICFSKLGADLLRVLKENSVNKLYFEASDITVARFNSFKSLFNENKIACDISSTLDKAICNLRIVKDETEIDKIQKAQQITEKAYIEVLNFLKVGVSEKEIAAQLEFLMKMNGAEDISFDLITITGKKTSLPHGVPSDDVVKEGDFFTFDIGAVFEGYHSDTTRTVAIGYATDEMQEIYNIVLKAQLAALEKIRSGVLCSEVDKTARDIIENAGYGKYFGHSTGHGVGIDIHEAPNVSPKSDFTLEKGMVITDEPGIYLPEKFGVRIEDMVCVTEKGCKNFVSLPKELIIL